jgi:hypothetical protein
VHLLTQSPLGSDAVRVADEQHADHQLRVDRGPAHLAVVGAQVLADAGQVDEAVDRAQQVVLRDVPLRAELVEQRRLLHRTLAHHQLLSRDPQEK